MIFCLRDYRLSVRSYHGLLKKDAKFDQYMADLAGPKVWQDMT